MKESPAHLRIYLFGRFSVERGGQLVTGFEARRLQELFSYLLLNRRRRCSRELLASLFWGESSAEQAKKNLRQILWQLQTVLEEGASTDAERTLNVTADWVQINPHADLWLDVDFFTKTWDQTRNIAGKDINDAQMQQIRLAMALHQEVLLPDNYDNWCLRERERLLALCLRMLEKLMEHSEMHHDYEAALRYGLRILDFDRTSEIAYQRLMQLYYFLGQRVEALKQYRQCEIALLEELGAQPSKSTRILYQHILLDPLKNGPDIESFMESLQGEELLLENILKELQVVQNIQTHSQNQVSFHIQKIEQMLQTIVSVSTNPNTGPLPPEQNRFAL